MSDPRCAIALGGSIQSKNPAELLSSINASDMALLKKFASRKGLEKMLQSLALEAEFPRNHHHSNQDGSPIQTDHLIKGNVGEQFRKQSKNQQHAMPKERGKVTFQTFHSIPAEVDIAPKKPVSTRGRMKSRAVSCTDGRIVPTDKKKSVVKDMPRKGALPELRKSASTDSHATNIIKQFLQEEQRQEEIPETSRHEQQEQQETRQSSSSMKRSRKREFFDGSRYSKHDRVREGWQETEPSSVLGLLSENDIQRIAVALEVRFAPRLDALQSTLSYIQSRLSETQSSDQPPPLQSMVDGECSTGQPLRDEEQVARNDIATSERDCNEQNVTTMNEAGGAKDEPANAGGNDAAKNESSEAGGVTPTKPWAGHKVKSIRVASGRERAMNKIVSRARRIISQNMDLTSTTCNQARLNSENNKKGESITPDLPKNSGAQQASEGLAQSVMSPMLKSCHEEKFVGVDIIQSEPSENDEQKSEFFSPASSAWTDSSNQVSFSSVAFSTESYSSEVPSDTTESSDVESYTASTNGIFSRKFSISENIDQASSEAESEVIQSHTSGSSLTQSTNIQSVGEEIMLSQDQEESPSESEEILSSEENGPQFIHQESIAINLKDYQDIDTVARVEYLKNSQSISIENPSLDGVENEQTCGSSAKQQDDPYIHYSERNRQHSLRLNGRRLNGCQVKAEIPNFMVATSKAEPCTQKSEAKVESDVGYRGNSGTNVGQRTLLTKRERPSRPFHQEAIIDHRDVVISSGPTMPFLRTLQHHSSPRLNPVQTGTNERPRVVSLKTSMNNKYSMAFDPIHTGYDTMLHENTQLAPRGKSTMPFVYSQRAQHSMTNVCQSDTIDICSHPSDEEVERARDISTTFSDHHRCALEKIRASRIETISGSNDNDPIEVTLGQRDNPSEESDMPFDFQGENVKSIALHNVAHLSKNSSLLTDERIGLLGDGNNSEAWSNSLIETASKKHIAERLVSKKQEDCYDSFDDLHGQDARRGLSHSLSLPDYFKSSRVVSRSRSFPLLSPKIDYTMLDYNEVTVHLTTEDSTEQCNFDQHEDSKRGYKNMSKSHQTTEEGTIGRPSEIIVDPQEMASPCTSVVSGLSYPDSSPPLVQPGAEHALSPVPMPSLSPPNTMCCSPTSLFDMEDDDGRREKQEDIIPMYNDDGAGAVVWANPNPSAGPPVPAFDRYPPSNSAFAIIVQKIAEAEAALKAELARESIEKFRSKTVSSEIELGNESAAEKGRSTFQIAEDIVNSKNAGQATTILADNDNLYIELVHVGSAALFDRPASPDTSLGSRDENSVDSHVEVVEDEEEEEGNVKTLLKLLSKEKVRVSSTVSKSSKTSYLERFQSRNQQQTEMGKENKPDLEERFLQKLEQLESPSSEDENKEKMESEDVHEIDLGLIEDIQNGETLHHDAAQIYDIVKRYYHYHKQHNAGDPRDFAVPLERRLKEPLDKLLTWTTVAFESIEDDFLASFNDDGMEAKSNCKPARMEEGENAANKISFNEKQEKMHPLERVGLFHANSSDSDSTRSSVYDTDDDMSADQDDDQSGSLA